MALHVASPAQYVYITELIIIYVPSNVALAP